MAELTSNASSPDGPLSTQAGPKLCKSDLAPGSAGISPLNPHPHLKNLIFVRYFDHVMYNRAAALALKPQTREAIGWLVYDCDLYLILSWDRDAEPPTLHGGDPKASGLVLLKQDILSCQKLKICPKPLQKNSDWHLNCQHIKQESEYAFRPSERKTLKQKENKK